MQCVRALVLFGVLATMPAWAPCLLVSADEESGAKHIWVYEKDGEKREVHVTHMSPELRNSVHTQLEAKGWKRMAVDRELADEAQPEEVAPKKDPKKLEESTKRDIEELIRGGGKLPEGFSPSALGPQEARAGAADAAFAGMARAAGRVMLRYLEVKDDPVKGRFYAKMLGEVAKALVGLDAEKGLDASTLAMRLLGTFMRGMNDPDPETAAVYREIVHIVSREMGTVLPRGPKPPPGPVVRAAPESKTSKTWFVGGAHVRKTTILGDRDLHPGLRVLGVEPGSMAHEMGLRGGDILRKVNGRPARVREVETIRQALGKPGKLSIELERRNGKIEVLDIEFEADEEPASGSGSK